MSSLSITAFDDDDLCSEALSVDLDLFDYEGAFGFEVSDQQDQDCCPVATKGLSVEPLDLSDDDEEALGRDIKDELDKEFWQVMAGGGLLGDTMIRTTGTETKVQQPSSESEANPIAISHAGSLLFTNQDETNELATLTTSQVDGMASDPHVLSQLEFVQDNEKIQSDRPGLESSRPDYLSKLELHQPTSMSMSQEESHLLTWAQSYLAQAEEETKAPKVKPSGRKDPQTARTVKIRMANQEITTELATLTTSQVDGMVSDMHVLSQQLEFVQDNATFRSDRPGLEISRPDHLSNLVLDRPTPMGVPQEESHASKWAQSYLAHDRPGLKSSRPDHPSKLVLDRPTPMGVPQEESHASKWAQSHLAEAEEEEKASKKIKPSGKKDPRTAWAVKFRMPNPEVPLEDVLLKAGYTFDFKDENGRPVDADNISLKQRKNHLCRMVRKARQRRPTAPS